MGVFVLCFGPFSCNFLTIFKESERREKREQREEGISFPFISRSAVIITVYG